MKRVRDTKAAQSLAAWVITNKRGELVATVQAYYGASRVSVDVYHNDGTTMQQGSASGYGYDKFTSALSGMTIDGHTMADHAQSELKPPRGRKTWPHGAKPKKGYSFANYCTPANDLDGWESCFKKPGMQYLEALGYRVFQAI